MFNQFRVKVDSSPCIKILNLICIKFLYYPRQNNEKKKNV